MNKQIDFSELLDLSDSVGTSLFTTFSELLDLSDSVGTSLFTTLHKAPLGYHNFSLMLDETYTLSDSTVVTATESVQASN
jgi:hypothetical protein